MSARRGATGSDTIAIAISCVSSGSSASDDSPIRYGTAQGSLPTLDTDAGPVTAAFVIAADGATGEIARLAGWEDGRHLIPALEYEVCVDDATFDRFARVPRFEVCVVLGNTQAYP